MTKKERIEAAVHGRELDRIPFSFWSHFPGVDMDPVKNAEHTCAMYKTYDIDIIKTMSNGMYSVEDYGVSVDYSAIAWGGAAAVTRSPVRQPQDWEKIQPLSVNQGALARELAYLDALLKETNHQVPVVFTVFSPLTTAAKLCPEFLAHIQNGWDKEVKQALGVITETTCHLVQRVIEMGADGIFFATQQASYKKMSDDMYKKYGVPYDTAVLSASRGWCNVIHAHGEDTMFPVLRKYPAQIYNWHAFESLPEPGEGEVLSGKCVMTGIDRRHITAGQKNGIEHTLYETIRQTKGRHLILSPGCVIRYPLDPAMLSFVRRAKEEIEDRLIQRK